MFPMEDNMATVLTSEEEQATHLFLDHLNKVRAEYDVAPVSWNTAVRFLMARKFDVRRAIDLFRNHTLLRYREGLSGICPTEEPLSKELLSGKFTILPHRDSSGAAIALFSAKLHIPNTVPTQTVLQAAVFQLDHALSNMDVMNRGVVWCSQGIPIGPSIQRDALTIYVMNRRGRMACITIQIMSSNETQRNGLTWIYNMTDSAFANFDLNLSKKLLGMLREGYPARLKRVYVVTPPLWFKAMYKVLTPLLKEKMKERVTLVSAERLSRYLPVTALPKELGGTLENTHLDWLNSCVNESGEDKNRNSSDISESFVDGLDAQEANQKAVELFSSMSKTVKYSTNHRHERQRSQSEVGFKVDIGSQLGTPDHSATSSPATEIHTLVQQIQNEFSECKDYDSDESYSSGTGKRKSSPDEMNGRSKTIVKARCASDDEEEKVQRDMREKHEIEAVNEKLITPMDDFDEPTDPPPKPPLRPTESRPPIPERPPSWDDYEESIHMPEPGLNMEQLVGQILHMRQSGIYKEYAMIRAEPPAGSFNQSRHKFNLPKNRYADVLCYDHSRVRLSPTNGDPYSDYINANYMDGYKQKNAFIAAQGPLPKTFGDFWRMIWEQKVLVVVMTTRTIERGRLKCGQYWPIEPEMAEDHGPITVVNLKVDKGRDYTITELQIQNNQTGESRRVAHYQFTSWPDFGTPRSAAAMLEFREEVRRYQADAVEQMGDAWTAHPWGPPILVHCSAGIGRTGTFCTLDISLARLEDIHNVDIHRTVQRMRGQRAFSIQTPDQYEFCYFAIVEYAQRTGKLGAVDFTGYEDSDTESDEE